LVRDHTADDHFCRDPKVDHDWFLMVSGEHMEDNISSLIEAFGISDFPDDKSSQASTFIDWNGWK
jgi:hypothetical protein